MNKLLIFACGALTGAAATLGAMAIMYNIKKHNSEEFDDFDDWEEVDISDCEIPQPKPEENKEQENEMNINKEISNANNELVKEYVSANKEQEVPSIEPWIMKDEEWEESPYEKAYLTYYAVSDVLADENLRMIDDNRCGSDYINNFENGVVHVCNEDEQVNYEIRYFDGNSFEEDTMNADEDFFDID